jgi:hypothetical protein
VTQIAGERVEVRFKPVDLDKAVALLRRKLDVFIDDPADTVDLESKPMRDLLIALARQGVFFYKTIVRDWDGQSIAEADRIQVVAADPDAYLPIEFVYDRVAPRKNARLCPHARRALEQGQCADECPKGADQARVVCPLGFWCLTKIIERHGHTKARARDVAWDYDLYSEPTGARRWLGPFGATSFAASSKVDDLRVGRSAELLKELRASTGATVSQARTWVKWTSDIEKLNPSLLVLLPHTLSEEGEEFLEIGKRAQLGAVEIEAYHVHSAESTTRPIVFLLGCETGDPELAFQKFPTAFRQGGAAIVLATLTPVFGHHAAPVAARIVTALVKQSTQQGITFGEVMLDVRRHLVLEGLPVVLALTAYGDADWRLGVQPGSPEGRTAHVHR